MNASEKISALLNDDGTVFETEDGRTIEDLAREGGAEVSFRGAFVDDDGISHGDSTRYLFPDGSAIVVSGDAWGIEGDEPFSWEAI